MVENVINLDTLNTMRGDGAPLAPSSKMRQKTEVKTNVLKDDNGSRGIEREVKTQEKEYQKDIDPKELNEAIERLNEKLYLSNREIVFKMEKKINKHYISVIDKESQEVIKEFPPKEIRKFMIGLKELEDKMSTNSDIKSLIINMEV